MSELRYIGSFGAVDSGGNSYTIHEYAKAIRGRSTGSTHASAAARHLQTDDGRHVTRVDQGVYEINGWQPIRVTSDDPDAP